MHAFPCMSNNPQNCTQYMNAAISGLVGLAVIAFACVKSPSMKKTLMLTFWITVGVVAGCLLAYAIYFLLTIWAWWGFRIDVYN